LPPGARFPRFSQELTAFSTPHRVGHTSVRVKIVALLSVLPLLSPIIVVSGVLLFVMKGVQQHLKISEIYRASLPIVLIQLLLVALLMLNPDIVT